MASSVFTDVTLILATATVVSLVVRLLKQPLLVAYIATGLIVGPSLFDLISDISALEFLGSFGAAMLLFIVGLQINLRQIKNIGRSVLIIGLSQIAISLLVIYPLLIVVGIDSSPAAYLALGLSFSSTILVLKILADLKETSKLQGQLAVGFLLVQDILAAVVLLAIPNEAEALVGLKDSGWLFLNAIMVALVIYVVARFVIKPVSGFVNRSVELLFLVSLAWGFGIAAIFKELGLSVEIGALVAGLTLASSGFSKEIGPRLRPIRDFFIIIFFAALGLRLDLGNSLQLLPLAALLTFVVVVLKPMIILLLSMLLGYTRRTSFKFSLAMGQVSEFSIILVLIGAQNGSINNRLLNMFVMVTLLSFMISTYFMHYSDKIYGSIEKYLIIFELREHSSGYDVLSHESIIFGFKKGGLEFAKSLTKLNKRFFDCRLRPGVVDAIEAKGYQYYFGDATDKYVQAELGLSSLKSAIITVSDFETASQLLEALVRANPRIVVICNADSPKNALKLYEIGASYVMLPHIIGTEKISSFISKNGLSKAKFASFREKHLEYVQKYIGEVA